MTLGAVARCIFLWLSALAPLATASEPIISSFDAQCFSDGEAGSIDRSSTTIRLLLKDWVSHELVSFAAAFVLKEWLGYNVELVRLGSVPNTEENADLERTLREGIWDVDLESWIEIQNAEHRDVMGSLLEPVIPIGYSGRSGLYVMPYVVNEEKYADWYKFYAKPGQAASSGFRQANEFNETWLREIVGDKFPVCKQSDYPFCGTGGLEGFWVPDHCVENLSSCIVVEMGDPSWDQGYFEQVINNLKLPMIFAYLGSEGLAKRRLELETSQEKVVWYSWSSNWGADFYGGVRISFPDPASTSVIQGYSNYANGTLAVDYPDVVLLKLISRKLFPKAPEAYWMLRNFKIEPRELFELLGTTGTSSEAERIAAACQWLKLKRSRVTDWTPSCTRNASDTAVFDRSTGSCSMTSKREKCFSEDSTIDNSKTVIRLGRRDWLSHDLMRSVAGLLLSEKLGYSVRYIDVSAVSAKEWVRILESNDMDAEMESWQVDIYSDLTSLAGNGVIATPTEIGWVGREGLFFMPDLVASDITWAVDFYKFYEGPEARLQNFTVYDHAEALSRMNGASFCTNLGVMGSPLWAQGTFEQLAANHNLSIAFAYYGGRQLEILNSFRSKGQNAVFYGYLPSEFGSKLGISQTMGRISFPDYKVGCASVVAQSPYGPRTCGLYALGSDVLGHGDIPPTVIYKIRRQDLAAKAPEAAYVVDNLQISPEQVELMLKMHEGGGGNLTTEQTACEFLKQQPDVVLKAVPECITNPIPNPKIGDVVWNAAALSCQQLFCPKNQVLIYDSTAGLIRCRECKQENAGTVPSPDQMSCMPCPAGSEPDSEGAKCQACPPGRYAPEAATPQCQACPQGEYNPLRNQSRCAVCPFGAHCYGGFNGTGATSFYADEGFYLLGGDEDVTREFEAKMSTCADCWRSDAPFDALGPFECSVRSACLGNNSCLVVDGELAMSGPLCGSCTKGYQRSTPDEPCSRCPPDWLTVTVIVEASMGNLRGVYSIVFKILCNFFVQLKAVGQVTDLNSLIKDLGTDSFSRTILTSPIAVSMGIGDVLENPSTSIFSLDCLMMTGGNSVSDSHYLKVLGALFFLPAVLLLMLVSVAVCTWMWSKCFHRRERWGQSSMSFRVLLTFSSLAVLALYFLQPMVTSQLLAVYNCRDMDDGGHRLDTARWALDMSVDCNSPVHQQWQLVTSIGLLIWSFGIPFVLYIIPWAILKWTSYTLQSKEMWSVFGFLYDGFEPDFWYYESFMMLRKTYILIAANIMWLRDLPYDNRAYMGVDRLQFQSLATFTWLLLGRLFRTMLELTDNAVPKHWSPAFYLPAMLNFFFLIGRSIYLILREIIWPLQSPPTLMPKCVRDRLDHRVTGRCSYCICTCTQNTMYDSNTCSIADRVKRLACPLA
eukprot:s2136_g1.t1